jgi:hypothetical protein
VTCNPPTLPTRKLILPSNKGPISQNNQNWKINFTDFKLQKHSTNMADCSIATVYFNGRNWGKKSQAKDGMQMSSPKESFRFLHLNMRLSEKAELCLFSINPHLQTPTAVQYFEHSHLHVCQLAAEMEELVHKNFKLKRKFLVLFT